MTSTPDYAEIRKWHAALLAWKGGQTTGRLMEANGKACCLGVYTELCGLEKELGSIPTYYTFKDGGGGWESTVLPLSASLKLFPDQEFEDGFSTHLDPMLKIPPHFQGRKGVSDYGNESDLGSTDTASSLNDCYKLTFKEIAECIAYTYPEAFLNQVSHG